MILHDSSFVLSARPDRNSYTKLFNLENYPMHIKTNRHSTQTVEKL